MIEGWHGDDYLILFADDEVPPASVRYSITQDLPGYQVVGLRGWDDLIVRDSTGRIFSVPAVPLDAEFLAPFELPPTSATLKDDQRFRGKIKWYVKPIVFGGDPNVSENLTWLEHDQHGQLVTWWNKQYRDLRATQGGA
jgi:hypothetical protein